MRLLLRCALLCINATLMRAQDPTVSATDRYCHAANAGWINARPSPTIGIVVTQTCLSGRAYAANFGWIDFGDGSPGNGYRYSNDSAADFGVNLETDGGLTGFAYAANVGWIRFEQTFGKPKLDYLSGLLSGYAWSANLGWLSFDTSTSDMETSIAVVDTDSDGIDDAYEYQHWGNLTSANSSTDSDSDGQSDVAESIAGTDPKNSSDRLWIIAHSHTSGGASNSMTFTSVPNRLYRIEHQTSLTTTWSDSPLGTFVPDTGANSTRLVTLPAAERRFFRIVAIRPLNP